MKTKKALYPLPRPLPHRQPAAPLLPPLLPISQRLAAKMFPAPLFFISSHTLDLLNVFLPFQVVKSGSSESRVEKRIVITADSDADQEQVQVIKVFSPC